MPLNSGSRLGPYEIVAPLGAGGMGEVYRAGDPRLGRDVAIKVISETGVTDPDRLRRFEQEARAVAALSHPNILAIFDIGVGDTPFLVTEVLEGETLRAILERGPLTVPRTTELSLQLVAGLSAAHARGIVHRDLKPDNVFILRAKGGRPDFVKIIDFGISKFQIPGTDIRMTQTGVVMGTPLYMSPEQVRGEATDARTDIYSAGVILYEALTGQKPFTAANYNELILMVARLITDRQG